MFDAAPHTWERITLGEIVARAGGSIQTGPFGSQLHASDYVPVGIPCIMPVNIGDNRLVRDGIACIRPSDAERLARHIVRKGDIIYSRRGDVERRALVREAEDGWFCGTGCLKLRLGEGVIEPEFASYYLGHPEVRSWIVRHAVGATMPNLNTSIMESIPFLLPPPDDQRAIAAVLGSLDDKIEVNRRTARVLEGIARTIFRSWFVDFDPVRNRQTTSAAGQPTALPDDLATLFPTRLVDSPLGDIPEGWEVRPLPEVFEVNPTRTLRKGETAPYLDMSNMPTEGHAPTNWIEREVGSGMKFINGDTLVARITPCLENGKTAFVDFLKDGEVAWGSTEYIVLRPREPIPPIFAYLLARSGRFRSFAIQAMTGSSGRQRVPADSLAHFEIAVPPPGNEQLFEMFASAVEPLFSRMQAALAQSRSLAALRDVLLPKLISGELPVKPDDIVGEGGF